MKVLKTLLTLILLGFGTGAVFAQGFTVLLSESDQVLNTECVGGVPIPDGTLIQILTDYVPRGPSANDTLVRVCSLPPDCPGGPPGTVNFNTFQFNGTNATGQEGQFYTEVAWFSVGQRPDTNFFYLRVCLGDHYLYSNTFSPSIGFSEYEFATWACLEQPCPGCQQPPAPTAFTASDNTDCDGVELNWSYDASVEGVDQFQLYRDGALIASVPATERTYTDTEASAQVTYNFAVEARRACGQDFAYSPRAQDTGIRYPSPAIPSGVTASSNTCDSVRVFWQYSNNAGTDSFIIKRDDVRVGAIPVVGSPGARIWYHVTATRGPGDYTVVGRNVNCGEGTPSAIASGEALQEPVQVTGVAASDGVCDTTIVTWNDVAGELTYHVWRANADGSGNVDQTPTGLAANTVRYNDMTATSGVTYRYTVVAQNACGLSLASAFDNGFRVARPVAPTSFNAADSANCAHVALTWVDVANETGYKVLRSIGTTTDTLATLPPNATSYNDSTAFPGLVYSYAVRSFSDCGGNNSVANLGSRKSVPPQPVTFTASDATQCTGVALSWSNVPNEDGYLVYRNGQQIGTTGVNQTTYTDVGPLTPGLNYGYAVQPYNNCGNGVTTVVDSGRTRPLPGQVLNLVASDTSCTTVRLIWNDVANEDNFQIYRGGTLLATNAANDTDYVDTTAPQGVNSYYIVGTNTCGSGTASASVDGVRVPAPAAVQNILATENSCVDVTITWTDLAGETGYEIRRDGAVIGTTGPDVTTFADVPPENNTFYTYTVVGHNVCGAGAVAEGDPGALAGPTAPQSLTATTDRCTEIHLAWQASSGDLDGYRVYQDGVLLATVDATTLTYDATPAPGSYQYTVTSFSTDCNFESDDSNPATGMLLEQPTAASNISATTLLCSSVELAWTAGTGSIDGYIIRRNGVALDTVAADVTGYTDIPAVGTYQYEVLVYSAFCTEPAPPPAVTGTRLPVPTPPTNVTATTDRCDSVVVTWTAATGTFDNYRIFRDGAFHVLVPAGVDRFAEAPTSGVSYRYTVIAEDNLCGVSDSTAGSTGSRSADASVPENLLATGTCTGVALTWSASTGSPAEYRLYRDGTYLATVAGSVTNYDDNTAVLGESYTYTVVAWTVACGETSPSAPATGSRITVPVQVAGLSASTTFCPGVLLQWDAVVSATEYKIYRDGTLVDSVVAPETSYTDINLAPRESHNYTVAAENACGTGEQSAAVMGTRYDVPDAVTGLAASDSSCVSIHLVWSDVATETRYVIFRDGTAVDSVNADVLTYIDAAAAAGTHDYVVYAVNTCGPSVASSTVQGLRIAGVDQVTGLTATTDLCEGITLAWSDLPNETGFNIYRDGSLLITLDASMTTYNDLTATPGAHDYAIAGLNVCGEGAASAAVSGFRVTVPPQVTTAAATVDSCSSVTLNWSDVATEERYYIYRDGSLIDSTAADVTTYRDDPLTPGAYIYSLVPANFCGNGTPSAAINGRVADVPGLVQGVSASHSSCDSIIVTWEALDVALSYEVFRNSGSIGTVDGSTLRFADAPEIGFYDYQVRAINACGVGGIGTAVEGYRRTIPVQVTGVTAADDACGELLVSWTNITDATGYRLFRDGELVATVTDTLLNQTTDPNPPEGPHQYTVQAFNLCGDGPLSDADTGIRLPSMPQVEFSSVTAEYCDRIELFWTDLAGELGYRIYRNDVQVGEVGPDVVTFVDNTAPVGAHPYYVKAFNICGEGPASITLSGVRRGAPAMVTNLAATDDGCANVVITWTDVADELGYIVYRDNTVFVGTVGPDITTITDQPAPGTYLYSVQSYNDCDTADVVTDNGTRLTTPLQVTGVVATTNRCDSVIVTWTDVALESSYIIYRNGTQTGTVAANETRFADAPAVGVYTYTVRGVNVCGDGGLSTPVTGARLSAPQAPTSVAATDNLCSQVTVTWTAAIGNVDSYLIYQGTTQVGTVPFGTNTFTHNATGTFAYHVVSHSDACGDSPASATDNGTGHAPAGVPTALAVATPARCDTVRLTWTASTGEVSGYVVRRDGTVIGNPTTNSFNDVTVPDARPHQYTVAAQNAFCGESAPTAPVAGNARPMLEITSTLEDTVYSEQNYIITYQRCNLIQTDSVFVSLAGGPYTFLETLNAGTTDTLVVPAVQTPQANSHFRVLSQRGARIDTLTSPAIVVMPPLASGDYADGLIPEDFFLDQNYPNPFNPSTTIRFGVPRVADVAIRVYDITGREVMTIVKGALQPGVHKVVWDCSGCPTGMYLVRLETGDRVMLRKMLLMK